MRVAGTIKHFPQDGKVYVLINACHKRSEIFMVIIMNESRPCKGKKLQILLNLKVHGALHLHPRIKIKFP
jgi:hypothetical protein